MTLNSPHVEAIIDRYSKLGKIGTKDIIAFVPVKERRYKCHTCHTIVEEVPCPRCGDPHLEIMCPLDHCHCSHEITEGIAHCPLCGEPVCTDSYCLCHDVFQLSRVTGYYANVNSFNNGKRQELKDRHRYDVATQVPT